MAATNNVKSKQVKSTVIEALKSIAGVVDTYCHQGKTPKNGLIMLAGLLETPEADQIPYYV